MTIDDVMEKHSQLVEEARAIARGLPDCKTGEEVDAMMQRFFAARQRAIDFIDQTVAMMRAGRDDLPRA